MRELKDLQASDRRLAAIHEAGHVVVTTALGYDCRAWLYGLSPEDPVEEMNVGGKTEFSPTVVWDSERSQACQRTPSTCEKGLISIAGVVAKCLFGKDGPASLDEICDWVFNEDVEPSETDRNGLPSDRNDWMPLVETTYALLFEHKKFHGAVVQLLIENGELTDGAVGDLARECGVIASASSLIPPNPTP